MERLFKDQVFSGGAGERRQIPIIILIYNEPFSKSTKSCFYGSFRAFSSLLAFKLKQRSSSVWKGSGHNSSLNRNAQNQYTFKILFRKILCLMELLTTGRKNTDPGIECISTPLGSSTPLQLELNDSREQSQVRKGRHGVKVSVVINPLT